ncbi:MAG: carbohydrate-binding protein [Bacteroidales bacterium]|nr:carbohydrate-binding protein [Bacteroidales bacterium]
MRKKLFLIFIAIGFSVSAQWRSELYPSDWQPGYSNAQGQFLHDFSYAGYERGEKPLPETMNGLYANVLDYGADNTGANDATAAIQSAIDAVQNAGGGTVFLPAGTYKVKPAAISDSYALKISGSNILFKGEGKDKTFIRCYAEKMRNCQIITVTNGGTWNNANDGNYYYLSQDIPSTPTTTIHLNDVGNLAVGDWIIIRSDRTQAWIDEHGMGGFWSASVNPTTMGTTFYRQITEVNANEKTITIDIPTRYYMKTRDNARVYKVKPKQSNVGLMDFSIGNKANSTANGWGEEDYNTDGNGAYYVHSSFLIKFALNVNCFAKNISSYQAGNAAMIHMTSNGLNLDKTRSLTIENCDFSHPQYEGGGGNGYGINICGQETFIKDCSSTSARHSFSFKYSYANGNVIYHYTSTDPKYGSDFHMYLSMANLIDNEELNGDFVESVVRPYGATDGNRHGHTSTQTVFWNTKGNYYKSGNNYIIDSRQYGYGYIIGTQGAATAVKTSPTSMSSTYGTANTAPEDYKEGIGNGATLVPQSLYYDQLNRRLNGEQSLEIPGTIPVSKYTAASNGITLTTNNGVTYAGGFDDGSYIEFKANAAIAARYNFTLRLAAGDTQWNAESVTLKIDNNEIATIGITASSGWENFITHTAENIAIANAGEHTITLMTNGGACNISDIVVTKVEGSEQDFLPANDIPGTVSVSDFIEKSAEISINANGYAGNTGNGTYLAYRIRNAESGKFKLTLSLAAGEAQWNAESISVKIDDNTAATVPVTGSTGWENFIEHYAEFDIAEGTHILSLTTNGGACNIADFAFERIGDATDAKLPNAEKQIVAVNKRELTLIAPDGGMTVVNIYGQTIARNAQKVTLPESGTYIVLTKDHVQKLFVE